MAISKRLLLGWVRWSWVVVALLGATPSVAASVREPVAFKDAYHDGFALVSFRDLSVDEVKSMLVRIQQSGATHLIIPYFGCQTDIHSSDVGGCEVRYRTSAHALARLAIAFGFDEVSYLPIVETLDWQWRGFFDPTDVAGWFKTYTAWIRGIARDAKSLGMKELVVSSETTRLYRYEAQWKQVLAEVRQDFDGPLILTVNWGDTDHTFWDDADAIGVSAYYPLSLNVDPSQDELDAAWRAKHDEFTALSGKWHRPIHVTEVGYASITSAARTPWEGTPDDKSDFALQARCYEAFRKAWVGDRSLVRANIWATEVEDPTSDDYLFSFETIGKPAEAVLKHFFGDRLGLRGMRFAN